jgi:hypothetical protein
LSEVILAAATAAEHRACLANKRTGFDAIGNGCRAYRRDDNWLLRYHGHHAGNTISTESSAQVCRESANGIRTIYFAQRNQRQSTARSDLG